MHQNQCRWGFLSTALIGRKNWKAIKNAGNATLAAVASRSLAAGQSFIDQCQSDTPLPIAPAALDSYEELIESDEVDAIYIPLPTGLRKRWVIQAAEAGKHVLCEKPCAISASDLQEMIEACAANNVQFMDGVMFMHSDRLVKMREVIEDGTSIGQIKRIATQFSFYAPDEFKANNIRTDSRLEPHGCLGDLGWYALRFILWAMDYQMPVRVCGRILSELHRGDSPAPVPMEFSGELFFEGGVSATFYNSFQTQHQQWANISGTGGYLHIPDFVLPYYGNELAFYLCNAEFRVSGCDFNMENSTRRMTVPQYASGHPTAQESNLFRRFSQIVLDRRPEPEWPEIALKTQLVLDACFQSAKANSRPVALKDMVVLA